MTEALPYSDDEDYNDGTAHTKDRSRVRSRSSDHPAPFGATRDPAVAGSPEGPGIIRPIGTHALGAVMLILALAPWVFLFWTD
jgi:hypothetical protein